MARILRLVKTSHSLNRRTSRSLSMGMVLGKITVETPKYDIVHQTSQYEIRQYGAAVAAEVTYEPSEFKGDKDGGFSKLARYIGAIGQPQNVKPEKIAMTAPVITKEIGEKIAMTAPVITKDTGVNMPADTEDGEKRVVTMQFLLPAKYQKAEDAPKPLDESVVIKEVEPRKLAVVKFSGVATDDVVKDKVAMLSRWVEADGFKVIGAHELARFNPPFTLPPLRTNEVMLPVE